MKSDSPLHGEIETPRPLRAREGRIALTGWCFAAGSNHAPPVRLVTEAGTLVKTSRVERPDVAKLFPTEPAAGLCGFTLAGRLNAGVYPARFEAQMPDKTWVPFKQLSLAVEPEPFRAALDEPIREGTLRDRVKVGGWALDPAQPVAELWLRYGHREIACHLHRPRPDVAAQHPGWEHAARAGFESADFLVAGHGPVRIRARLGDGRVAVVPTPVSFSIATDENHGPELDLTGKPIGLPPAPRRSNAQPPAPAARPRNLLFLLPGSFAANHALHVAALANELSAAGHACTVAAAHDPSTLSHHEQPAFRAVLHQEIAHGIVYPDGRGPDFIHAWTPRENVRRLAENLRLLHGARVVVHLEDNEQEILALTLGRPWSELAGLAEKELDRLVPANLSHPLRSRAFLEGADGVTVITGRLKDFVPKGKATTVIPPAADARFFFPRPVPADFRRLIDAAGQSTLLFYHGNVHAANAAEMRELYSAVLRLNQSGQPVTLLRAGLDTVDFLGALAGEVAPYVLPLGQIPHHRHLPSLMALADIFVQPGAPDSFNDYRFPSKLPEFFALGRPVVLPRTNLGLQVRHGIDAYLLERADAGGIATAVGELRCDRALYDRLAAGAATFSASHFSWRRSAEALAKFYDGLTA